VSVLTLREAFLSSLLDDAARPVDDEARRVRRIDAHAIVAHVRRGEGTVGAFLMDEEVYDDVAEMVRDLKHNPWKLFWRD